MAVFSVPNAKPRYKYEIERFQGADLANAPNNMSLNRSPACPNMIRDEVGKVKKRYGYETVLDLSAGGKINGIHAFRGGEYSTLGADVCTGGTILKSSERTTTPAGPASNAFDNNNTTRWATNSSEDGTHLAKAYIGYQFATAKTVRGFSVYTYIATASNMPSVKLQCSDDGTTWADVATQALDTTVSTRTVYPTADGGSHVYWRLLANANLTGAWSVMEVEFFEMVTTESTTLIHSGTKIYSVNMGTLVATDLSVTMNDSFSKSFQFGGNLYIVDGDNFWLYNGTTIAAVTGYIPTIIISRLYSGGGTLYEPVNLITPWRTERFLGDGTNKIYQLTATGIDADAIIVKSLQADGSFVTLALTTDYTVNASLGRVTFVTVKPTPAAGVDNIYITYAKSIAAYADRIKHCTIGTVYGLAGAKDRLILSGNPSYRNTQWHSKVNDPTYWGDTYYTLVGRDDSSVINYSIVNDYLIAHKDSVISGQNAYMFSGELVSSVFTLVATGSYMAEGAYSKHSFASFENEPMYLTVNKKISAITPQDYSTERFSQERSYYLSSLLETYATSDSYACIWGDFYVITGGEYLFILDSLQPVYERGEQYSNRQYEGFYWKNVNARLVFDYLGTLYFGDSAGKIKRFSSVLDSDDAALITAYWETPELDGKSFADKKTFVYIGANLTADTLKVSSRIQGTWAELVSWTPTDDTIGSKIKIKNADRVQFRFENSTLDQTFNLRKIVVEYAEGGKYSK